MISTSDDAGASWSEPRAVDVQAPADAHQFLPSASVNAEGVLALTWLDTRGAGDTLGYQLYATASLDGGDTFLAPRRVSSAMSRPLGAGNLRVNPSFFTAPGDSGATRLVFLSAAGRWLNGGDYTGLAASADGSFHPFWADARDGTFTVWTARLRVEQGDDAPVVAARPAAAIDVTAEVAFLPDPSHTDASGGELVLPLRVRNTGSRTLLGPLTLEVRKFGSGMGEDLRAFAPTVLNAANGRAGNGATFLLDEALGSDRRLRPGDTSGPVELRLRLPDPLRVPNMHLTVRAAGTIP